MRINNGELFETLLGDVNGPVIIHGSGSTLQELIEWRHLCTNVVLGAGLVMYRWSERVSLV